MPFPSSKDRAAPVLRRIASLVRAGALVLAAVGAASCAEAGPASPRPFHPGATTCRPPTAAQSAWLPAEWTPFARAVRVCRIADGRKPAGLLVVSVWTDVWYKPLPDGTPDVAMPKPLLLSPAGQVLGTLPANFPDDPPSSLRLRFVGWQDGLPGEIRLCLTSDTPAGQQPLAPLRYDAATHHYDKAGTDPEASTKDECHAR